MTTKDCFDFSVYFSYFCSTLLKICKNGWQGKTKRRRCGSVHKICQKKYVKFQGIQIIIPPFHLKSFTVIAGFVQTANHWDVLSSGQRYLQNSRYPLYKKDQFEKDTHLAYLKVKIVLKFVIKSVQKCFQENFNVDNYHRIWMAHFVITAVWQKCKSIILTNQLRNRQHQEILKA